MKTSEGFLVEIHCDFAEWWRYNAALMAGCFDATGQRTGFASAEHRIASPGDNLHAPPTEKIARTLRMETPACERIDLYIYIIPHTMPRSREIGDYPPFPLEVRITRAGKVLHAKSHAINQWGGASIELKLPER